MPSPQEQSSRCIPGTLMMTDRSEFGALAQERSQGYWLLSRLFLQVPDTAHLLALQTQLAGADAVVLNDLRHAVEAALAIPDDAAVEFTRLLVIVSKASGEALPYESFAREGTVPGAATERVLACMADAGFAEVAPDAPSPDHIGAELKFMALLCYEESQAWDGDDLEGALQWLTRQRQFMASHLADWAVAYCAGLEARAQHGYMKAVAALTASSLVADFDVLAEVCAEVARMQEPVSPQQATQAIHDVSHII
jgi:TorA maturation chaperone TorD